MYGGVRKEVQQKFANTNTVGRGISIHKTERTCSSGVVHQLSFPLFTVISSNILQTVECKERKETHISRRSSPKSVTMAEELAPKYLSSSNLQTEIQPISTRIDEMLLRLEEFENLLTLVREESAVAAQQNIPRIAAFRPEFESLCERLDKLESFVGMVSKNLDVVERQVQIAEEELDIPDKTINVLLKSLNIFGKPKQVERQSNRNAQGMYEPATIFKTEDYFGKAKPNVSSQAVESINDEGSSSSSSSKTTLEAAEEVADDDGDEVAKK